MPQIMKELKSFLGLAGYYRKFVKHYSLINSPLIDLLKKGVFEWTEAVQHSFIKLKQALVSAPHLF